NLSQNQTLQFKSVAKISVGRKSESQSSFPFAIHLSMNHTDSLGAKQFFYAASLSLSTSFFHFRESFFRGPVGATRWREGDLCLIFKPASRTFLPSGKISFSVALSDVASSLARTALCAFSTPPSSIFPQKILRICSLLTDYSINIPKRHRKMFAFFFKQQTAPPPKAPLQATPEWSPRNASTFLPFRAPPIQRHKTAVGAPCQMPLPAP
ncbi:hypothetical protein, partial [Desulfovibrio piger]|uniref:hypothetical protein n=1 Tax=Desulfovibrio piger TaxID=901 RepID=UPI0026EC8EA9